jgi:hypothetical protein
MPAYVEELVLLHVDGCLFVVAAWASSSEADHVVAIDSWLLCCACLFSLAHTSDEHGTDAGTKHLITGSG